MASEQKQGRGRDEEGSDQPECWLVAPAPSLHLAEALSSSLSQERPAQVRPEGHSGSQDLRESKGSRTRDFHAGRAAEEARGPWETGDGGRRRQ